MVTSVPISVSPRAVAPPPRWELSVRYGAAYACTLIAVLAAWPRIAAPFALLLCATTLAGLPLSLALRRSGLRLGRFRISRPIFNGFVLATTLFTSAAYLWLSINQMTGGAGLGAGARWLDLNLNRGIELLIGVFLLFAVCRCLFILTDKDALLCTVPSFSVLLLLIVVQREASIVLYFLLWSLATAILLALDHRGESRVGLSGTVPAVVPGQEISLPARSLGGVIVFSLVCSSVLAYGLASGSQSRSAGENWIIEMVSRWSNFAVDTSESSYGSSLSRRIDFSSGPTLPSRRVVWHVRAVSADGKRELHPALWRSFTLSKYDGKSWAAGTDETGARRDSIAARRFVTDQVTLLPLGRRRTAGAKGFNIKGFTVRARQSATGASLHEFGTRGVRIRQQIIAQAPSTGFLPSLPAAQWLVFPAGAPGRILAGEDASLEIAAVQPQDQAIIQSVVPPSIEYGTAMQSLSQQPHDAARSVRLGESVRLSARARTVNLQLPAALPPRVRALPAQVLGKAAVGESASRQARRLALWVQNRASYSLRPPITPDDRDATDYFLFEGRRGYCTYFAGALTILCRARGIPARVVAGYANPEWAPVGTDQALFNNETPGAVMGILREANGHAWTEIWQDGQGWMPVDATPPDDRGDNAPGMIAETGDWLGGFLARLWRSVSFLALWLWRHALWLWRHALWLSLSLPFLFALHWMRQKNRAAIDGLSAAGRFDWFKNLVGRQKPKSLSRDELARAAIKADYARAARQLSRRFRPRAPGETPREWLQSAATALQLRDMEPLRRLTELYEHAGYRPRELGETEQAEARRALQNLSWKKLEASETQMSAT